jgi:hypothetical protein
LPSRKIIPEERAAVLDFLKRWHDTMLRIEDAANRMRIIAGDKALGIKSMEYEKVRVMAMAVVHEAGLDSVEVGYWPQLSGRKGPALMKALSEQMYDAFKCQLNVLRVWGLVTEAFRRDRKKEAPSIGELVSLNAIYAGLLDRMGVIAVQLAVFYKIPAAELEAGVPQRIIRLSDLSRDDLNRRKSP